MRNRFQWPTSFLPTMKPKFTSLSREEPRQTTTFPLKSLIFAGDGKRFGRHILYGWKSMPLTPQFSSRTSIIHYVTMLLFLSWLRSAGLASSCSSGLDRPALFKLMGCGPYLEFAVARVADFTATGLYCPLRDALSRE